MIETKYARDSSGASVGLTHWRWGSRRTMDVTDISSISAEELTGHTIFIETSVGCHIRLGAADVVAGEQDPKLKPGVVYALPRAIGETHVAARSVAAGQTGVIEFWQADSFVEA